MSHSFVNQLIHIMWSTRDLEYVIPKSILNDLLAYLTVLVKSKGGKVIHTGGSTDHVHLLILLPPQISLSSLISHLKTNSSKWIKTQKLVDPEFSWQDGFLGISSQEDRVDHVCEYIKSEEVRHKTKNYSDELLGILKQQDIVYNEYFLSNSHSKIYIHAIWSTFNRVPILEKSIRQSLYSQINDIFLSCGGKVIAIGGVEDHVHALFESPKNKSLSDLIREAKTSSTHWLKNHDHLRFRDFEWQTGYGAFSVGLPHVPIIGGYIQKQEMHHQTISVEDEWKNLLVEKGWSYSTDKYFAPQGL